ncbi:nitroreductase [Neobacillus cucumis]|uniref:nitroreductase family protein n=1 Tax=Neobacillus cucumis TaxID=1740721 RepID=UPI0018DF9742|nr:nitroreductase [Neobacillus cucumis]MBI0575838.1 nitroreductase [Neobacillus cucumis]WHY90030.1 nitroreductase [Neobacillus cucumis]
MSILETIKSRRTIKKFKTDPVHSAQLMTWLEAAAMAPNHRMTEPWEVYIIGQETRAKLNHKTNFGNAPVLMAVLSKHGATALETEENALATACFVQNFSLAAWEEGIGTFWSSIAAAANKREILGVPEGYDVIGVFGVGYPEEISEPKPRTPMQNKLKELP